MLIEPRSRFFQQYELSFRAARGQGVPLKFFEATNKLDALSLLRASIGKEWGKINLASNDECKITQVSLSKDKKFAAVLFRRSSPDASTPFFGNRNTGALRKADRSDEEDLAVSAHLFIDMSFDNSRKNKYRAILEEVPSLGKSYVHSVIYKILKSNEYSFTDRNGQDKTTFTACRFDGYASENLLQAIGKGSVPFVELVRTPVLDGLDSEAFRVKEQKQRIYLRAGGGSVMEKIKTLKDWATGQNWDELRVQVRLPDGRSRLVPIAREDDAASVLFVRAQQVYVAADIDVCCENVEMQLFGQAIEVFSKDWNKPPGT
jgi:hypothetical protein